MSNQDKIIVGISIGDLNGIGSEIVLKTFQDPRMLEFCTPVIFASVKVLSFFKKHYNIDINLHGIDTLDKIIPKKINVLNLWKEAVDIDFGKQDNTIGQYAVKSLEAAVLALKQHKIDVLVTAPINKSNIQSETFNFPGHTDYLQQELEGDSMMLMISETLRVGLLTDHVAVKDISANITREVIEKKINTIHKTLIQDFGIAKPKIAVLGINPHTEIMALLETRMTQLCAQHLIICAIMVKRSLAHMLQTAFLAVQTIKTLMLLLPHTMTKALSPLRH